MSISAGTRSGSTILINAALVPAMPDAVGRTQAVAQAVVHLIVAQAGLLGDLLCGVSARERRVISWVLPQINVTIGAP